MLIKSHEQLNQAVCEIFFSSQLSKMDYNTNRLQRQSKSILRIPASFSFYNGGSISHS